VARNASPARLVIALSVAAVLAVFLLYTSIAGGGIPRSHERAWPADRAWVQLAGVVVGPARGDAHAGAFASAEGYRQGGATIVAVRYSGPVPDLFGVGRHTWSTVGFTRGVHRRAGHDDHEVPVEVRAEAHRRLGLTVAHA
jgi:hypothetical protein